MTPVRSEGARQLGDVVGLGGNCEAARRLRTSEGMVRHLVTGRRTPSPELRKRIAEAFGVDVATWERPAKRVPKPKAAPALSLPPRASGARSGLVGLRETVEALSRLSDNAKAEGWPPRLQIRVLGSLTEAAYQLAKLQGEDEITVAMVLRSRHWRDVMGVLGPMREAHPEAARALDEALDALVARSGGDPLREAS